MLLLFLELSSPPPRYPTITYNVTRSPKSDVFIQELEVHTWEQGYYYHYYYVKYVLSYTISFSHPRVTVVLVSFMNISGI